LPVQINRTEDEDLTNNNNNNIKYESGKGFLQEALNLNVWVCNCKCIFLMSISGIQGQPLEVTGKHIPSMKMN